MEYVEFMEIINNLKNQGSNEDLILGAIREMYDDGQISLEIFDCL